MQRQASYSSPLGSRRDGVSEVGSSSHTLKLLVEAELKKEVAQVDEVVEVISE